MNPVALEYDETRTRAAILFWRIEMDPTAAYREYCELTLALEADAYEDHEEREIDEDRLQELRDAMNSWSGFQLTETEKANIMREAIANS